MATVADTMLSTVPQLDLILTPNGFGIVSNQNVVPASKERIERLTRSLEKLRDDAFVIILLMLPNAHKWTESEQYASFAATMFPNLTPFSTSATPNTSGSVSWRFTPNSSLSSAA